VAYRPVAKRILCKQPLLGNTRNTHARNKKKTVLCNPFLGNGSVNTLTTIELLLKTAFSVRSVKSGNKEDNRRLSCWLRVGSPVELCKGGCGEMML
jgi:hypothetical protein